MMRRSSTLWIVSSPFIESESDFDEINRDTRRVTQMKLFLAEV